MSQSIRLRFAQTITRYLPPYIAQALRSRLYPLAIGQRDKHEFRKQAVTGSDFVGNTADYYANRFSVTGYDSWRLWACAIALCKSGDTIVEVGANIGTETIGFSDIVGRDGRVIAFEPYPPNVEQLTIATQDSQHDNITIYPLALGSENRQMVFALPTAKNSGVGRLLPNAPQTNRRVLVDVRTLDSMQDVIGEPRLIVVDAEGAESLILHGATDTIAKHKPHLILEASPDNLATYNITLRDLHQQVSELGYVVYTIWRFKLVPANINATRLHDWLAIPIDDTVSELQVHHTIRRSALMPMIQGLNPLKL